MAVTVNIYYTGKDGRAEAFAREMTEQGIVEQIRQEEGNLRYAYFFPMGQKDTVLLIDSWKDQRAIDAHHASEMMAKITALRNKYDLHMKVERYVSEDVPADTDQRFIRQ
jgi:quinol monooxygenase YgiN